MTCSLRARKHPVQEQRGRNPCPPVLSIHQVILLSTPFITLGHSLSPAYTLPQEQLSVQETLCYLLCLRSSGPLENSHHRDEI